MSFRLSPGCDCCGCCIQESELPDLSIDGMTGGAWQQRSGDVCCWEKDFTFNSYQPTELFFANAGYMELEQDSVFNFFSIYDPGRIDYSLEDPTFDFTLAYPDVSANCCKAIYTAGKVTTFGRRLHHQRFNVFVRKSRVTIRLQKKVLDCREDNLCRWIVTAKFFYGFSTAVSEIGYSRRFSEVTDLGSCTNTVTSSIYVLDTEEGNEEFPPFDPDDYINFPPTGTSDPTLTFVYIKDYVDLPESIVFNNEPSYFDSEEAFACLDNYCNSEEPVEELCFTYSYDVSGVFPLTTSYSLDSVTIQANPTRCTGQTKTVAYFSGGVFQGTGTRTLPNVTCTDFTGTSVSVTPAASNIVNIGNRKPPQTPNSIGTSTGAAGCKTDQPVVTQASVIASGVPGWFGEGVNNFGNGGFEDQISFDSVAIDESTGIAEVCVPAPTFTLNITT